MRGLIRGIMLALIAVTVTMTAARAQPEVICTLITDAASGAVLHEDGDCAGRVTPASTFKIPLAVMGYDAGILTDAQSPVLSWRPGEPDWGGAAWRRETGPADWMRHSVVWYSQRITAALGAAELSRYARAFGYGNADMAGDAGYDNGLERAWIASSLRVSPLEQAAFLRGLVQGSLPVRAEAMAQARGLLERQHVGDWTLSGKTGSAYPRRADRSLDYERGWGWYVGWAQSGPQTLVFVRLTQGRGRSSVSGGIATRDLLLRDWSDLMTR